MPIPSSFWRKKILPLALLVCSAAAAKASVVYTFSGADNTGPLSVPLTFQLVVPTFINAPIDNGSLPISPFVSFSCDQLLADAYCGSQGVQFQYVSVMVPNESAIKFSYQVPVASGDLFFTFPGFIFSTPGTYTTNGLESGTLSITETPEPAALTLLLMALFAFGAGRTAWRYLPVRHREPQP